VQRLQDFARGFALPFHLCHQTLPQTELIRACAKPVLKDRDIELQFDAHQITLEILRWM
jgi:hypothetical protein